jgi:hypothetical protein
MRPHEGAALFRMASETKLVYLISLDQLFAKTAMHVMTARTFEKPLFDRMVRLFIEFGPDVLMTGKTEVRFVSLQFVSGAGMDLMAISA